MVDLSDCFLEASPNVARGLSSLWIINRFCSYQMRLLSILRKYFQCSAQRRKDKETLAKKAGKLEKQLSGSKFFNGEMLGTVDIARLTLLHRAAIVERYSGYDFIAHNDGSV